ncbi:MAG: hypothetical protein ABSG32_30955 [Terriglobia bacterium]|jgi:hypothetical protein
MGRRSVLVIVCLTLLSGAACFGQQIVINRIALLQTRLIQTTKSVGTAFVVNVDNREYWITAKHIFSGIENAPPGVFTTKTVQANILLPFSKGDNDQDKKWETVTFTTIDPGKDIDILVLVPDHSLTKFLPAESMKLASDADPADEHALVPIGGDCDFLGYPYGSGWRASIPVYTLNKGSKPPGDDGKFKLSETTKTIDWAWSPFVKRCTLSASMVQNGITVFVLDGINNLGFSGGPVVTGNGGSLDAFAVISSFHAEPLEVLPAPEPGQAYVSPIPPPPPLPGQKSKQQPRQVVESNSGLILAYDITPAIKAIHGHPIGPQLAVPDGNGK